MEKENENKDAIGSIDIVNSTTNNSKIKSNTVNWEIVDANSMIPTKEFIITRTLEVAWEKFKGPCLGLTNVCKDEGNKNGKCNYENCRIIKEIIKDLEK